MSEYSANPLAAYSSDSGSSVFEPDVMLPSQFLVPDEQGLSGGERKLMAALLSDGIEAFIHQSVSQLAQKGKTKSDACEWIEAQDDSYVFSFDNVCECLGINPEYLRIGLFRYIESVRLAQVSNDSTGAAWKKIRRPRKQ
ncbi:MAG: hypothetical protein U0136_03320 [Bdellovibrionota bacterium]